MKTEKYKQELEVIPKQLIDKKDQSPVNIDLNNMVKLKTLGTFFNGYTPYNEFKKWQKQQYRPIDPWGKINEDAIPAEQAIKDLHRFIGWIKRHFLRRAVDADGLTIDELIVERKLQEINIQFTDQRECFIKWYNNEILKTVEKYCNYISHRLSLIFDTYFTNEERERLNLLGSFAHWYKEFSNESELSPPQKPESKRTNLKLKTLIEIFPNDETKISIIKEAIKDLSITKDCSDRIITGFIDACKLAHALPEISNTILMNVIYFEIGKPVTKPPKPRTDQKAYFDSLKATKNYFGIK
jgi:hypothetical protein